MICTYIKITNITNNKIRKRNLIPYRITSKNIKYETNRWYYNAYWNQIMKVTSVKYNDNGELEQCFVMWEDDLFGMICTDLDVNYDYKLEYDSDSNSSSLSIQFSK